MKRPSYKETKRYFLRLCDTLNMFFCTHEWTNFKIRKFEDEKMDDKGNLNKRLLIRTCAKCKKTEVIGLG